MFNNRQLVTRRVTVVTVLGTTYVCEEYRERDRGSSRTQGYVRVHVQVYEVAMYYVYRRLGESSSKLYKDLLCKERGPAK